MTGAAKDYVAGMKDQMPPGIEISTFNDRSLIYKSRMDLLLKNGIAGLLLVFLCLALTLQFRLALWVSLGIAISFLGAFWAIPLFGVSLNMISMFAFIVSLGIVVDDAIVVGENIYSWRERGHSPQKAATTGALEVGLPGDLRRADHRRGLPAPGLRRGHDGQVHVQHPGGGDRDPAVLPGRVAADPARPPGHHEDHRPAGAWIARPAGTASSRNASTPP